MARATASRASGEGGLAGKAKASKRRFSRQGDAGYTSLLGTKDDPVNKYRVPKYHLRPETYGVLDEVNAVLSMARNCAVSPRTRDVVFSIQQDLHILMAELATAPEAHAESSYKIGAEQIKRLEHLVTELQDEVQLPIRFIISASCFSAGVLDLARTVLRRAERWAARLRHEEIIANDYVNSYINRCADLLWTLARYEEAACLRDGTSSKPG